MIDEQTLERLEAQANMRLKAKTKHVPGVSLCLVTPHELLELIAIARKPEPVLETTNDLVVERLFVDEDGLKRETLSFYEQRDWAAAQGFDLVQP